MEIGFYNTPTDIGYYLACLVGIAKGDIRNDTVSQTDAINRLIHALEVLKSAPKKDGLLYWYDIFYPEIKISPTNSYVSAIDNAFYSAALGLIIGAFIDDQSQSAQRLVNLAFELLAEQKEGWSQLYDPERKLLLGGYSTTGEDPLYYIDRAYNEGRLATLMAIILGDVPRDAWENLEEFYLDYTLSHGKKMKILAPWESAFQAWMPLVFVPEMEWSPQGFKIAHQRYLEVQIDWAQRENMPALYAECSDPFTKDKYQYITGIAIPGASESSAWGVPIRSDIGSVYAIGLAYMVDEKVGEDFFAKLITRFPEISSTLGWFDSVGRKGTEPEVFWATSRAYVAKNQFVLLSALNYQNNHRYFTRFLEVIGKLEYIRSLYNNKSFNF
ncbi:MAG: hypothetical protein NC818_00095 [Candidatus Omnitrophica bacterium]|nr:hypothetical protein [Candidatus Omnitrophota bacterium]